MTSVKQSMVLSLIVLLTATMAITNAFTATPKSNVNKLSCNNNIMNFQLSSPKSFVITQGKSMTKLNAWSPFGIGNKVAEEEVLLPEVMEPKEPGPYDIKNILSGLTWISLIVYAFNFAPGTLGSDADNELIQLLITQPTPRPSSVNELWFATWNSFTIVPAVIAALATTTASSNVQIQRLPAWVFLWMAPFIGFFGLGPYFATRTDYSKTYDDTTDLTTNTSTSTSPSPPSPITLTKSDLGWASRTIFENRIFGIVLSLLAISIPFSSDIVMTSSDFDFSTKFDEFVSLYQSSRFVSVACIDIFIMSIVTSMLISEDVKLRGGDGWKNSSLVAFATTMLLPVIGPALYLAVRPSLPEE